MRSETELRGVAAEIGQVREDSDFMGEGSKATSLAWHPLHALLRALKEEYPYLHDLKDPRGSTTKDRDVRRAS